MAIQDFEWEGEIEVPTAADTGTALVPPKVEAGTWLARLKKSVWVEPALRLFGMALLLGVLAGIGVVATTYAKPGLVLPERPRALAAVLGTSWLKPTAAAEPEPHRHGPPAAASAQAAPGVSPTLEPKPAEPGPGASPPVGITADGKIILNVASADELTKLPGVGAKRAQAIVALRTKLKRFKHATDLLRVKGIGPRGLQRMLPHLVLDAPSAS